MGHSSYDPVEQGPAWNAGKKLGAKRPLKPKEIWEIRFMLDREHRLRDRALFDLAIDSKLRGCDLVKVRICDLVSGGRVRNHAMVIQQTTKRPVQFELLEAARSSLLAWLQRRGGSLDNYAFPSRVDRLDHLSTRQYSRLVEEWVSGIGLRNEDYGTHSLRESSVTEIGDVKVERLGITVQATLAGRTYAQIGFIWPNESPDIWPQSSGQWRRCRCVPR